MRIACSGTISTGKSTFIEDFIKQWPIYKKPSSDYRDLLKSGKYPHSKNCTKDGQWAILNLMIDEMQKYSKDDFVIFDRSPLDNLVFSLWSFEKGESDIDQAFIDKCIPIVRESMRQLDILFFVPLTKVSQVPLVDNGFRETDPAYRSEIDNIFKALNQQYYMALGSTPFFPKDDSPALIEIFGTPQQRVELAKLYIGTDGNVVEDANSILDPENINDLEKLVLDQATEDSKEKYLAKQKAMATDFLASENKKRGTNFTPPKKKKR